jgi:nitroreductase
MTANDLDARERDILLHAAILAPSILNTQPWKFRSTGRTIELLRDLERELPAADPERRMSLISSGAALFNLRVAAAHLRLSSTVAVRSDIRQALVCEVHLSDAADPADPADGELAALYPQIFRRRTNRWPFENTVIPGDVRRELSRAATLEGASLEWAEDATRRWWLLSLMNDANLADATDPDRITERRAWVGGDRDRDGIPSTSLGPRPALRSTPVRNFAVDRADQRREAAHFEERPDLAVLATRHDTVADWVVAGQALERVLLVATAHGVSSSLLSQAMEHKDLRWLGRDPLGGWMEAQTMLRFGYGPEVPPTPRRPLAEFVLDTALEST